MLNINNFCLISKYQNHFNKCTLRDDETFFKSKLTIELSYISSSLDFRISQKLDKKYWKFEKTKKLMYVSSYLILT